MTTEQLLIESLIGQTESRAIFELRYTTLQTKSVQLEAKNIELDSALKACGVKVTQLASDLQKMREDECKAEPKLCALYETAESLFRVSEGAGTGARKDAIAETRLALSRALAEARDFIDLIPF